MPTLPFANTVISVEVEVPPVVDAIVKSGVFTAVVAELEMDRSEYGEVVPMPKKPLELMKIVEVACATPASLPTRKLPLVREAVCLLLNVDQSVLERSPVIVAEALLKSEEVAIAVGTAEAPVPFTHSEFAAIAAKLIEEAVPPTWYPRVPDEVRPVPTARVDVAIEAIVFTPVA